MLVMMRRKGNPHALLVVIQTGAATVENHTEFPQKITCLLNLIISGLLTCFKRYPQHMGYTHDLPNLTF